MFLSIKSLDIKGNKMKEANVADFEKKSLPNPYGKTSQGELSDAASAKEKGAGLHGKGLAVVGVNLSDVPVNGVAEPKKAGAGGGVESSMWSQADVRTLYNDQGKASNAGK